MAAYSGRARNRLPGDERARLPSVCCCANGAAQTSVPCVHSWQRSAGGENILKKSLFSHSDGIEVAVRFRGVSCRAPLLSSRRNTTDSTALKTTFFLRAPKTPLNPAARTLCENAFGRTGVANRELSLHLSPVSSPASVSPSEILRGSLRQRCHRVQFRPLGQTNRLTRRSQRQVERPFRSLERTPIF